MTSPLNTEVIAKDTPVTVPTSPLALSRRSARTSRVTQVDRATPRIEPATDPPRVSATNSQSHGLVSRRSEPASTATKMAVAATKHAADAAVARAMASCLRWWSTKVPNHGPITAIEMLKAPPMIPVTTTDRVSR